MFPQPQAEHHWLDRFVGQWTVESECRMGPDQPVEKSQSTLNCRSLGRLWVAMEGECLSTEGDTWLTVLTLGYDPRVKRYLGTFVGSMMTHLWLYSGVVAADGRELTLDTEGPGMDGEGLSKYQDILTHVDHNHWILSSQILGADGSWTRFQTAHHRRQT